MSKYLVIVESPSKIKTIKKFLGSNYEVAASNGHIRDLPKSQMGIDIENDYEPKYITIRGKGDKLAELRKQVKKAEKVFLATDPDREGEAISWHLAKALKLDDSKILRITFNEITKNAVKDSLKQARTIDMNLVDAQQARRVLDRMVGYSISPLLWAKVKRGLSAGRVQSVALKLICDREDEINAFLPEEYWSLEAMFDVKGEKKSLLAKFHGDKSGKLEIKNETQLNEIMKKLKKASFSISDIKYGERTKKSPLPFITSTMQQEASKQLGFSTQKTMRIAQQLYEGVDIKGTGTVGIITYLRTDSTRVSEEAENLAREYIKDNYGENYNLKDEGKKKKETKIQDAHEAIRPTYIELSPTIIKDNLSRDQYRLYQLIWKRFVASRMEAAKYDTTSIKISTGEYFFSVATSKLVFDGFLSVYNDDTDEKETNNQLLNKLTKDSVIKPLEFLPKQHFTQPPAHYNEAALVKALEELGIGRPSTFAPTITTILARRYITKENKNLYVTELGEIVNKIMNTAFSVIVDTEFTANLESLLDMVEEGNVAWKNVIKNFYPDLDAAVKNAEKELEKINIEDEKTEVICEECGKNMVIKYGPHGKFLACPGFPECRNTKPYYEKIGVECPKCKKDVVVRKTKKGRKYYGCEDNPECDFMSWQKPTNELCPECNTILLEKGNNLSCMDEKCGFVKKKDK